MKVDPSFLSHATPKWVKYPLKCARRNKKKKKEKTTTNHNCIYRISRSQLPREDAVTRSDWAYIIYMNFTMDPTVSTLSTHPPIMIKTLSDYLNFSKIFDIFLFCFLVSCLLILSTFLFFSFFLFKFIFSFFLILSLCSLYHVVL